MSSTTPTSQMGFLPKYSGVNVKQLGDVDISTVANNELLKWNSTTSKWVNTDTITVKTGSLSLINDSGSNGICGTATLVSGTQTVDTTDVATGDLIFLSLQEALGTTGNAYEAPAGSITDGTSFVINAVAADGSVVTTDVSKVNWMIVHPTAS